MHKAKNHAKSVAKVPEAHEWPKNIVASQIFDLLSSLQSLSDSSGFPVLSHLLALAKEEAKRNS